VLENGYDYDDLYHQTGWAYPTDARTGKYLQCRISKKTGRIAAEGHYTTVWDGSKRVWDTMD